MQRIDFEFRCACVWVRMNIIESAYEEIQIALQFLRRIFLSELIWFYCRMSVGILHDARTAGEEKEAQQDAEDFEETMFIHFNSPNSLNDVKQRLSSHYEFIILHNFSFKWPEQNVFKFVSEMQILIRKGSCETSRELV